MHAIDRDGIPVDTDRPGKTTRAMKISPSQRIWQVSTATPPLTGGNTIRPGAAHRTLRKTVKLRSALCRLRSRSRTVSHSDCQHAMSRSTRDHGLPMQKLAHPLACAGTYAARVVLPLGHALSTTGIDYRRNTDTTSHAASSSRISSPTSSTDPKECDRIQSASDAPAFRAAKAIRTSSICWWVGVR